MFLRNFKTVYLSIFSMAIFSAIYPLPAAAQAAAQTPRDKIVATYVLTSGDTQKIANIPGEHLTHLLYAFAIPCGEHVKESARQQKRFAELCKGLPPFSVFLPEPEQQAADLAALKTLKAKHPHLKILLSIGGWSHSGPFHDIARSKKGLPSFVNSAIGMMQTHDVFDGVDIDWEFPGGDDNTHGPLSKKAINIERKAYTQIMMLLRQGLDDHGKKSGRAYSTSSAMTGSPYGNRAINWRAAIAHMDYLFVMTYDFETNQPGHHANLIASGATGGAGIDAIIKGLAARGVPRSKMVLGVPFYGRGWSDARWNAQGKIVSGGNAQALDMALGYDDITGSPDIQSHYEKIADQRHRAKLYVHRTEDKIISFDDVEVIKMKARWAREQNLAGIFSWEISDDAAGYPLTRAMKTIAQP